jgi:hypothetical protein
MRHTLSLSDYSKICDLIEQLTREARAIIEPSPEEIGACLVIDYFALRAKE